VCAAFALLRFFGAQETVNAGFSDFSRTSGLTDWERPGPYIWIAATLAFGAAAAGLFLFRLRRLHRSVVWAATAIVLLVLLAITHSVSLYYPVVVLQTEIGPLTVSRILEALLLLILALSALWFMRDSRGSGAEIREA
jgi:cytochrome bd-type quinol oxidase subunit 2